MGKSSSDRDSTTDRTSSDRLPDTEAASASWSRELNDLLRTGADDLATLVCRILENQRDRSQAGRSLCAETYLECFPILLDDLESVVDIIYNEFLLRVDREPIVEPDEYYARFPEYRAALKDQFRLHLAIRSKASIEGDAGNESNLSGSPDPPNASSRAGIGVEFETNSIESNILADRFEIKELVGEGSFAQVFKAWDRTLSRHVAIKIPRYTNLLESETFRRIQREAESGARLAHPGIVQVYEIGRDGQVFFIVQELIGGGSLADKMLEVHGMPKQAAEWVIKVGDAIDYAHQLGVVHRDIKPANILFDDHDQPRITDFGLASLADAAVTLTGQGDLLGTPAYMAPEQVVAQDKVDASADVYALGVVLYQLLTRQLPFQGSPSSVLHQTVTQEPVPPRRIDLGIPRDVEVICLKAMAKRPENRYKTAREMADDLRRFLNNEPIQARAIGPFGKLVRWCRRQPALAATLAVSVLLVTGISVTSFIRITNERDRYRAERDRSNRNLFQSLTKNVESDLRSKRTGWYENAMQNIRQAAQLATPQQDVSYLRELAIEVLSDREVRLEKTATWAGDGKRAVTSIAVGSDDRWIAAARADGSVIILSYDLKMILAELNGPQKRVSNIQISSSFKMVIAVAGDQLWVWKLPNLDRSETDKKTPEIAGQCVFDVDVLAAAMPESDGKIAVSFSKQGVIVFNLEPGKIGAQVASWNVKDNQAPCLEFSKDGKWLAAGWTDHTIRIWDIKTQELVDLINTWDHPPVTVSFAADQRIVIWSDSVSYAFDLWTLGGSALHSPITTSSVVQVGFVQGSFPMTRGSEGTLRIWKGKQVVAETPKTISLSCFDLSSQEDVIVAGSADGMVHRWKMVQPDISYNLPASCGLAVGPDGAFYTIKTKITPAEPRFQQVPYQVNWISTMASGRSRVALAAGTTSGDLFLKLANQQNLQIVRKAHQSIIVGIVVGPDDSWIASADRVGRIRFWDSQNLKLLREMSFEYGEIRQIAMDSNGRHLAVAGPGGLICWNITPLNEVITMQQPRDDVRSITVGPESLAIGSHDGQVEIRSIDGTLVIGKLKGHLDAITDLAFTTDGQTLVTTSADKTVRFWDNESEIESKRLFVEDSVSRIVIDPAGQFLVVVDPQGRKGLWSLESQQKIADFKHITMSTGVFSHDGSRLWFGTDGAIEFDRNVLEQAMKQRLATPEQGKRIDIPISSRRAIPGGHLEFGWSAATSRDGRWIATAGADRTVIVRDAKSLDFVKILTEHEEMVWSAAFSPDSSLLVTGSLRGRRGEIIFWDTSSWTAIRRLKLSERLIASLTFDPSGKWIVASSFDGTTSLIATETGKVVSQLCDEQPSTMEVEFSPDGKWLAAARLGRGVWLWSLTEDHSEWAKLEPAVISFPTERIWAIGFDPDNRHLACASESGTIRIIDLESGQCRVTIRSDCRRLRQVVFTPDGRYLGTSAFAGPGNIWDLEKLRLRLEELGLDW